MVERVDAGVGRILAALDRLDLRRHTIVIFTNDNGGEWLSHGGPLFHRKGSVWEGGIRVPALVRWPGRIPAGRVSRQVGHDHGPDGVDPRRRRRRRCPPRRKLDGMNLLPILEGRAPEVERTLFWRVTGARAAAGRPQRTLEAGRRPGAAAALRSVQRHRRAHRRHPPAPRRRDAAAGGARPPGRPTSTPARRRGRHRSARMRATLRVRAPLASAGRNGGRAGVVDGAGAPTATPAPRRADARAYDGLLAATTRSAARRHGELPTRTLGVDVAAASPAPGRSGARRAAGRRQVIDATCDADLVAIGRLGSATPFLHPNGRWILTAHDARSCSQVVRRARSRAPRLATASLRRTRAAEQSPRPRTDSAVVDRYLAAGDRRGRRCSSWCDIARRARAVARRSHVPVLAPSRRLALRAGRGRARRRSAGPGRRRRARHCCGRSTRAVWRPARVDRSWRPSDRRPATGDCRRSRRPPRAADVDAPEPSMAACLLAAVVRRFLGDHHVVDVALARAGRGDANQPGLGLQVPDRWRSRSSPCRRAGRRPAGGPSSTGCPCAARGPRCPRAPACRCRRRSSGRSNSSWK